VLRGNEVRELLALWVLHKPSALTGVEIEAGYGLAPQLARTTFWFWMWGVPGAILAVPMLAIVKIVCDRVRPLKALGHFLEG
jgi:hypothetical protein